MVQRRYVTVLSSWVLSCEEDNDNHTSEMADTYQVVLLTNVVEGAFSEVRKEGSVLL